MRAARPPRAPLPADDAGLTVTRPTLALIALVLVALVLRAVWLDTPPDAMIFDEVYYVNAARVILGWPVQPDAPYANEPAGLDPNREHPPLGKLYIAASMSLFGDDAIGWRVPSIVAGTASIALVYAVARAAGGEAWLGVLAAGLFAFDNLVLVHSRIATLDMLLVAFMLLAAWCALRGWYAVGGVAAALAALVKVGGVYGVLALLIFEVLLGAREWWTSPGHRLPWPRLKAMSLILAGFLPVWLDGLWLLDQRFSTFVAPWDHIRYMLDYGLSLVRPAGPANTESYPWQWLLNDVQIPYLRVDEQISVGGQVTETRATVFFRGAMNPLIIGAAPLGIAYAVWQAFKPDDRLGLWSVAWIAGTYLPFFPLALFENRISYIFYFLPVLPAIAVALALLLVRGGLPKIVLWGYLLGVLLGFAGYFPFRRFPPS